jgi:hypothetical protein
MDTGFLDRMLKQEGVRHTKLENIEAAVVAAGMLTALGASGSGRTGASKTPDNSTESSASNWKSAARKEALR